MQIWVNWNDPTYVWAGSEDFLWNEAYRIVNQVAAGFGGWETPGWKEIKKKIKPDLAEKFLDIVVKVNGLTQTYKVHKQSKPEITIEHIQKTFIEFGVDSKKVTVKADIKK